MCKDNYAYFVSTNGTPRDNGSKTLEKRELYQNLKIYKKGQQKKLKKETTTILHFQLKKKLRKIYPKV